MLIDRGAIGAWCAMTRCLVFCLLLTAIAATSVRGSESASPRGTANTVLAGLALDGPDTPSASPADGAADATNLCAGVSFSRSLRYGEGEQNVLDVATGDSTKTSLRPVLLFVAGESFTGDGAAPDAGAQAQDAAICFAARNGMVGVRMAWRLAPAYQWPAGARDVAAATSWVHENIDLFGGNASEIVVVGYSVGAFHVASLLAHREFWERDSDIAGAVLVSGIYHPSAEAGATEKSYFGSDASKYEERSAFPGILKIETPLLLAWSALDPPRQVAEGEKLRERLCHSPAQCPHTTVLKNRDGLASFFAPDAPDASLAAPTLELIREIEARGLP
jgi:acetyl esterase/lipase